MPHNLSLLGEESVLSEDVNHSVFITIRGAVSCSHGFYPLAQRSTCESHVTDSDTFSELGSPQSQTLCIYFFSEVELKKPMKRMTSRPNPTTTM